MTRGIEHDLILLLHGELPPGQARDLGERLRREPELAEAYHQLERTWDGLSLPPASPVPAGFSGRVMAHVRAQSPPGSLSWTSAPSWVRAAAAAALLAGAAAGVGVGRSWPATETKTATDPSSAISSDSEYNLADGYWDAVGDATGSTSTTGGQEVRR
jgi:anti-sigma factor RsiW